MKWTISLQPDTRTPKYLQLINSFMAGIEGGVMKGGDRLPSINELSERYLLSKETVERAYHELHHRGLVVSVARRGYFVSDVQPNRQTKVMLLVGGLTDQNRCLYQSLLDTLGKNAKIDVFTYGYRANSCREILENFSVHYHHVVFVPHLLDEVDGLVKTLLQLSGASLTVLGRKFSCLSDECYSSVTTDIHDEFYKLLADHISVVEGYESLNLILPEKEYIDTGFITAFRRFSDDYGLSYGLIDSLADEHVQANQLYITANDADLVEAIRQVKQQRLTVGREVGIISLGDSCLHELLAGGVTAVSWQPENVGRLAGQILRQTPGQRTKVHRYQPLHFIRRATF